MRFAGITLLLLMLSGFGFAQITTEGGNVTELNLSGTLNSTYWDGLYGEVVLGAGVNYTYTVVGDNVVRINMVAQDPNCTILTILMHVIAVNDTGITLPLAAGNLALLDAFVPGTENGSGTFTLLSTFDLTYGLFNNVPTTYTYANNATPSDFREGYLNDAAGNLVFVTEIVNNMPDWNGSTSDYQIMLPNNGSLTNYTFWVDVNFTCVPPGPGPGPGPHNEHKIYIYPPGAYTVGVGETFDLDVLIENRGDFVERDLDVYIQSCPAGFTCGSDIVDRIGVGDQETAGFPITVNGAGEYVLTVCAENDDVIECQDFIVYVTAECESDEDCGEDAYCDGGICKPKKKINETCDEDNECASNVCEEGRCVYCTTDDDCASDESCTDGSCIKIECDCGYILNHACIPYECCADEDCEEDEFCIGHACEPKELEILVVEGELIEDEELLVQVVNSKGETVPLADIFTNFMRAIADANAYATINAPRDGLIYAYKDGYPQAGLLLSITLKGFFVIEEEIIAGKETRIQVVDTLGKGIPNARVYFNGEMIETDDEGYFYYIFDTPGPITLRGEKTGYLITDAEINVRGEPMCGFPIFLNWFIFATSTIYVLWIISIFLAILNFALSWRRIRIRSMLKGAVYSVVPLLLALPGISIFTICLMSNIVVLQAIGEIILLIKEAREGKKGEKPKRAKQKKK